MLQQQFDQNKPIWDRFVQFIFSSSTLLKQSRTLNGIPDNEITLLFTTSSIKKTEDRSCPRKERGSNWQFEQWDCFVFSMFWHFFARNISMNICSSWNHFRIIPVKLFWKTLYIVLIFFELHNSLHIWSTLNHFGMIIGMFCERDGGITALNCRHCLHC